ncbi:MAG: hypothetical protein CK548_07190 [Opitutia bacterium]|nr:MAG: hypothetical protein CK548_07190 [Opitutae bacterium]
MKPNILFLFADDQRADTIAAHGNAHIKTPVIDGLVRRGVSFNPACIMGGMNAATCVPSRAMLLSRRSLFHIDETLTRKETWGASQFCATAAIPTGFRRGAARPRPSGKGAPKARPYPMQETEMRSETWPAVFGRAGYTTLISGKWHNTPASVSLSSQGARQLLTGGPRA